MQRPSKHSELQTRRSRGRGSRRSAGFTILELLVAVSLLSVLAVLSWRGMNSVLEGRDAIVSRSDELRTLTAAMAQIEEDLRRAWPVRLLGLRTPTITFAPGDDQVPPSLEVLREVAGGDSSQLQRVSWRLRNGVLERGFSPWVAAAPGSSEAAPELRYTWQPVVAAIEALEFRGWLAGRGWLPAETIGLTALDAPQVVQPAPGGGSQGGGAAGGVVPVAVQGAPLVTGVEMVLVRNGERIHRIFAVAD